MCLYRLRTVSILLCAFASQACGRGEDDASGRGGERRELVLTPPVALHDAAGMLLAKPDVASEDPAGRIMITDVSDRNVKVYDPRGAAVLTVGRAGHGPGEFTALMSAQAYHDSIVAYDIESGGRLSTFGPDGRFAGARTLGTARQPMPLSVRVVDDSLFLLVSAIPSPGNRGLLSLARPDGSTRSRFLELGRYLGYNPQLASAVALLADGADGRNFAAVAGGDSVWAFDYDGHRLGAFPADPAQPLVTVRSLLDGNGGRLRRLNGGYVVDGNRMVIGLVAMDSGTVALQIAPYDGRLGIDPEDGGTIVVSTLAGGGARMIARQELAGALLGRDRRGRLLLLRYTSPEAEAHELVRASLVAARRAR